MFVSISFRTLYIRLLKKRTNRTDFSLMEGRGYWLMKCALATKLLGFLMYNQGKLYNSL